MALASEYDVQFNRFVGRCLFRLAHAQEPLLDSISSKPIDHSPTEPTPEGVSHGSYHPQQISGEFYLTYDEVVDTDLDAWWGRIYSTAGEFAAQMVQHAQKVISDTCTRHGNVVDGGGKPISHDLILDVLEKMDMEVGDDLEFKTKPQLWASPQMIERLRSLDPPTPEQEERHRRIMKDKYERQNAQRRTRKLD